MVCEGRYETGDWSEKRLTDLSCAEDDLASSIGYRANDNRSIRDIGRALVASDLERAASPRRLPRFSASRDKPAKTAKQPSGISNGTVVCRSSLSGRRSSFQGLDLARLILISEGEPSPLLPETPTKESSLRRPSSNSRSAAGVKDGSEKKRRRRRPWSLSNPVPESYPLGTITEYDSFQNGPTISTVERAAAAKIFLETHFHEKLNGPKPREMRRQCLETQLFYSPQMDDDHKELVRESFYSQETWHLRETRALKAKSQHSSRSTSSDGPCADNYESLKVLGKGSFGVVRLVKERTSSLGPAQSARVFAMKVIRKSDMLRSSQEGHLRAERDFLVLSEGAHW